MYLGRSAKGDLGQHPADCLKRIAAVTEDGHNEPNGFERLSDIGIGSGVAAIMEADDAPWARASQDQICNFATGQLPVAPDDRPHDRAKSESAAGSTESEPTQAVWRPEDSRLHTYNGAKDLLSACEFLEHLRGQAQIRLPTQPGWQACVRKGMVTDLMPSCVDGPGDLRMAQYVRAALKKCCANILYCKIFKQRQSSGAWPVIERESYRAAPSRSAVRRGSKELRVAPTNGI